MVAGQVRLISAVAVSRGQQMDLAWLSHSQLVVSSNDDTLMLQLGSHNKVRHSYASLCADLTRS